MAGGHYQFVACSLSVTSTMLTIKLHLFLSKKCWLWKLSWSYLDEPFIEAYCVLNFRVFFFKFLLVLKLDLIIPSLNFWLNFFYGLETLKPFLCWVFLLAMNLSLNCHGLCFLELSSLYWTWLLYVVITETVISSVWGCPLSLCVWPIYVIVNIWNLWLQVSNSTSILIHPP